MISRRHFITSVACLPTTLILPGCQWRLHQPLTIASHTWPGYELLFLAQREGELDAQQVRLYETRSATESLNALANGKADGAALTLDEVLKARASGIALTVVLVFDISAGADVLLVRPEMRQLSDLKGRAIGFEQGAVGELMLAEILKAAHLSRNDVTLSPFAFEELPRAWAKGQIDACITYEPVANQLQALGARKLFDSRQLPDTIVDVLAVKQDALDFRHAQAIRHGILHHFRALDRLTRNPQDAAFRMANHLNLKASEVLQAYRGLVLPDASNNYRLLSGDPPPLAQQARALSAIMVERGLLQRDDDLNNLFTGAFIPSNSFEH